VEKKGDDIVVHSLLAHVEAATGAAESNMLGCCRRKRWLLDATWWKKCQNNLGFKLLPAPDFARLWRMPASSVRLPLATTKWPLHSTQ
jgi:hypothetical protein